MMNRLPYDILSKEIIPNLSCEDQISFVMSNVMLSNLLLKQTRSIHVLSAHPLFKTDPVEDRLQLYVTSQEFRDKVHGLVQDSYYQLKLIIPDDLPYDITGLDNITCNQLETTATMFVNSLCDSVKKVQSLRFKGMGFMGRLTLSESLMQFIAQWINDNNSSLALRELGFSNYDFSDLPVILNLQSLIIRNCYTIQVSGLHLTGYDKLRHLTLASCESIRDVSSLDGIHELYLVDCVGIRDVSCLNHNYKIVVDRCPNIVDYLNCFRYSKIIHICCSVHRQIKMSIDLSASLEAREITFKGGLSNSKSRLILPNCLSLSRVYVEDFSSPFTLPAENKIQAVTIWNCSGFSSLLNFAGIYNVKLHSLKITTLEGLSSANRIVEISRCHLINDFSVLRQCDKVVIDSCKGFLDISQVRGVRDFTYCPHDVKNLPSDLEGVTCLLVRAVPSDLFSFAFPSSLVRLVFGNSHFNQQILSLLAVWPPHIRKVEVLSFSNKLINEFQSMLKAGKVLPSNVTVQFKKGIHFFRG